MSCFDTSYIRRKVRRVERAASEGLNVTHNKDIASDISHKMRFFAKLDDFHFPRCRWTYVICDTVHIRNRPC
jgi:hypothetical protein